MLGEENRRLSREEVLEQSLEEPQFLKTKQRRMCLQLRQKKRKIGRQKQEENMVSWNPEKECFKRVKNSLTGKPGKLSRKRIDVRSLNLVTWRSSVTLLKC